MEVIITQWALDSYLDLLHKRVFTRDDYRKILRPDAELLKQYPTHQKFALSSFWSPAEIRGQRISGGFKMKWDSIGNGKVELRLPIRIETVAHLCEAYVKKGNVEPRKLAKFKFHCELIQQNRHTERGKLQ